MSEAPPQAWFFSKAGKQYGPVAFDELKFVAAGGELNPRQDLVWTSGMPEWKPAGEVDGLFVKVVAEPAPAVVTMAGAPNPYESSIDDTSESMMAQQRDWPGVARAPYFIGSVLLGLVLVFMPALLAPYAKGYEMALLVIPGFVIIASIMLGVKRLQNVGMSGWWYLGVLVPFLNLWVGYRSMVCPPGYAFHRKLDGAGIFLAVLYWLFIVAMVLLVVFAFFGVLDSPQFQKQIQDAMRESGAGRR